MTDREAKEQLNELKKTFNTLLIFESVTVGDKKEFLIKNIKALDVALNVLENERPKGRWIKHIDDLFPEDSMMECNVCHEYQSISCDENFCPNCGADMREVE